MGARSPPGDDGGRVTQGDPLRDKGRDSPPPGCEWTSANTETSVTEKNPNKAELPSLAPAWSQRSHGSLEPQAERPSPEEGRGGQDEQPGGAHRATAPHATSSQRVARLTQSRLPDGQGRSYEKSHTVLTRKPPFHG